MDFASILIFSVETITIQIFFFTLFFNSDSLEFQPHFWTFNKNFGLSATFILFFKLIFQQDFFVIPKDPANMPRWWLIPKKNSAALVPGPVRKQLVPGAKSADKILG